MPRCPDCGSEINLNDLVYDDNSFRDDPDPEQLSLGEATNERTSEGPVDSVWDRIDEDDLDLSSLEVEQSTIMPGDPINANDPREW